MIIGIISKHLFLNGIIHSGTTILGRIARSNNSFALILILLSNWDSQILHFDQLQNYPTQRKEFLERNCLIRFQMTQSKGHIHKNGFKAKRNCFVPFLRVYSDGSGEDWILEVYINLSVSVCVGNKILTIIDIFPVFPIHRVGNLYRFGPSTPIVISSPSLKNEPCPKLRRRAVNLYPFSHLIILSLPTSRIFAVVYLVVVVFGVMDRRMTDWEPKGDSIYLTLFKLIFGHVVDLTVDNIFWTFHAFQ